jgi:hypothetical protein
MSLKEITSIVRSLDYPHEKFPDELQAFEAIKLSTGVKYLHDTNYVYLSKFKKAKRLGVFVIERDKLALCNSVAGRYTMDAHVKSRRCDYISAYQYWQENRDEVLRLASGQLVKYKDDYSLSELPLELGGTGGSNSHIGLQHECAMALVRIGMPASFPANLMSFMVCDIPDLRILDISAGWGDRLLAACALGATYMACDPNTALAEPYSTIISKYGNGKQIIHSIPFEDLKYDGPKFNCLYSSPPFYDLEIYSTEETQSSERYKTLDSWLDDFLKVCLRKSDGMLQPGAYIYLHLRTEC